MSFFVCQPSFYLPDFLKWCMGTWFRNDSQIWFLYCAVWWWHNSWAVMGEACHIHDSGYCKVSVCAPLPALRTDCSAKDWTLSNSSERHARALCDHTPPTQHRAECSPTSTHINIYTHLVMPPLKLTCHSTLNNHRFNVDRLHNHSEDL